MKVKIPKSLLVVGAGCAALIVILTILWYPTAGSTAQIPNVTPGGPGPGCTRTVCVDDVDFIVDYWTNNTSDTSYITTPTCYPVPTNAECPSGGGVAVVPNCPASGCANVSPGAVFSYNLSLIVNDTVSHRILSIDFQAPFSAVEVSPGLPHTMTPGDPPTVFSIEVEAPFDPGQYDMAGTINTS